MQHDNTNTNENEVAPQDTSDIQIPPVTPPKRRSQYQRSKLRGQKYNPLSKENTQESIMDKLIEASFKEYVESNNEVSKEVETSKPIIFRDDKGRILAGSIPNPNGRPVGKYSLKTKIEVLLKHNPDIEARLIRDLLQKEQALIYEMIDGKPSQSVDVTHQEAPKPILAVDITDIPNTTQ